MRKCDQVLLSSLRLGLMGVKVEFDPVAKLIIPTISPDGDNRITLNVKIDIYSDGKEDWINSPALNKRTFPITAIGGQLTPNGALGTTYLVGEGWKIRPFESSHTFVIEGNIFTDTGDNLVLPTVGAFQVVTQSVVSTLVENVASASDIAQGVWSAAESPFASPVGTMGNSLKRARVAAQTSVATNFVG
jgi:hypothetical protein